MPGSLLMASRVAREMYRRHGDLKLAVSQFRIVWRAQRVMTFAGLVGDVDGRFGLFGTLPGTQVNLSQEAGDPGLNAVVSICLNWVARQVSVPKLEVLKPQREEGKERLVAIPGHAMVQRFEKPNPHYDGDALLAATAKSYMVYGEAYWLINQPNVSLPPELYFIPPWEIRVQGSADGSDFISAYVYRPGGQREGIPVPRENLVRFQFDLNFYNQGRTSSQPLFPILRNIISDNEGESYAMALLRNMGVPGHLINPKSTEEGAVIPPDARQEIEQRWIEKFSGDQRGKPLVAATALDVTKIALSPEELALDRLLTAPESRICAALGIPPQVVHLQSGQDMKTYANYQEARSAAFEDTLVPMLARFAETMERQLLPLFDPTPGLSVSWNYAEVPALQEDMDLLHKRAREDYRGGVLTRNEARGLLGYEPVPEGDEFAAVTAGVSESDHAGLVSNGKVAV